MRLTAAMLAVVLAVAGGCSRAVRNDEVYAGGYRRGDVLRLRSAMLLCQATRSRHAPSRCVSLVAHEQAPAGERVVGVVPAGARVRVRQVRMYVHFVDGVLVPWGRLLESEHAGRTVSLARVSETTSGAWYPHPLKPDARYLARP